MLNKFKCIALLLLVCLFCGCSCSKENLQNENIKLDEENKVLEQEIIKYENVQEIFDFYNSITVNNIASFVLVESKNTFTSQTRYSNGVVLGSNGLKYYILSDYSALSQSGLVSYRVMDKNANVYKANVASSNFNVVYDDFSGLVLLEVNVSSYSNIVMKSIDLGDKTDLLALFSSVSQMNQVKLLNNIKTSTMSYNDTSYISYNLEESQIDSGSMLINDSNELCGMYMSKLNQFISIELIKELLYSTYSLVL